MICVHYTCISYNNTIADSYSRICLGKKMAACMYVFTFSMSNHHVRFISHVTVCVCDGCGRGRNKFAGRVQKTITCACALAFTEMAIGG